MFLSSIEPKEKIKKMIDPDLGYEVKHRWIGWYENYSQWESLVTGRISLGPPFKKK